MLVDGEEPGKRQRSWRGQNGECRLGSIGDLRQEEEPIEHRRQKDRIRDKTNHKKRLGKRQKCRNAGEGDVSDDDAHWRNKPGGNHFFQHRVAQAKPNERNKGSQVKRDADAPEPGGKCRESVKQRAGDHHERHGKRGDDAADDGVFQIFPQRAVRSAEPAAKGVLRR